MTTTSMRKGPARVRVTGRVSMAEELSSMVEFLSPESSNIHGAQYFAATGILRVKHKNAKGEITGTYDYHNVPPDIWEGFRSAASKGKYFIAHIRNNAAFKAEKVA